MHNRALLLAILLLALPGCERQERFPGRPITLICPWAAGGGTDQVSRTIAMGLEQDLGVPVNVVNATGGGGVTGHTRGALARPDGYTLTTITPELTMLHWRGLTALTYTDFEPLMAVNGDNAALFVRKKDTSLATVEDLAERIRSQPRSIKASGSAFGSIWHIALAGWLNSMKLAPNDVIWVSINGSNPSLQELVAGTVDVVCCSVPEAQTLLDSGSVRCIAVMAVERMAELPDVPTLRERGWEWSLAGWRGLALPRGVPADRAKRILDALRRVVTGKQYQDFLKQKGFGGLEEEPAEFAKTLAQSDEQFGAILTSAAFRSVQTQRFGPMFFPTVLAVLFGAGLAVAAVRGQLALPAGVPHVTEKGKAAIALVLGAIVFYVLAAELLGFVLTASVLMLVLFWCLQARWVVAVAVTVCLVPALYQLFAVGLRVPLPRGLLGW